jgi:CHAT domain-containing protein
LKVIQLLPKVRLHNGKIALTITQTENKFLNELVLDCITYRLGEREALEYIRIRFKEISESSYKQRKAHVLSDESTQIWLNHFTRIGFVQHHKEQIEVIQKIQDDSLRQVFIETNRNNRNENVILRLKNDIRENAKLLSELGLGTPIISAIKAKLQDKNAETIQVR